MSGRRCAFLRMQDPAGWQVDTGLAIPYLEAAGWSVDWVPWRDSIDWSAYQLVHPAAAWDYPDEPQRFSDTLEAIERAGAKLVNPAEILRWNMDKRYLRDLERAGVAIVPSDWFDDGAAFDAGSLANRWGCSKIMVKPVIGTNAVGTRIISVDNAASEALPDFGGRAFIAQPFIEAISTDGEYSLFYMGGSYSHAIRKLPASGDYRVQEEHGASLQSIEASRDMRQAAEQALAAVQPAPAYARCDLVYYDDAYRLMELELIEPSMYLRMDPAAPQRFADALLAA